MRKIDHCSHRSASLDSTIKRTAKSGQLGRGTLSSRMLATRSLPSDSDASFRFWVWVFGVVGVWVLGLLIGVVSLLPYLHLVIIS